MAKFVPRAAFLATNDLPRSYFLGHHASGLQQMKTMVSSLDLVIECRDYRVPLASRNPLFEEALGSRERLIVYTKHDLGSDHRPSDYERDEIIRRWHSPNPVAFCSRAYADLKTVLDILKNRAAKSTSLTGYRIMIAGMPNVGKSTLLNSLRSAGTKKAKAARTGAQPGITRKIGSEVKILPGDPDQGIPSIYTVDTPGVFMPFVSNRETMLKLALVGCVKDTIIPAEVLMDYWLCVMNKRGMSGVYRKFMPENNATNDIQELLEGVCGRVGKIKKGGKPQIDQGALWLMQQYRVGNLGRLVLDEVEKLGLRDAEHENLQISLNQAKKMKKNAQVQKLRSRVTADTVVLGANRTPLL